MNRNAPEFPLKIKVGSVTVKIYRSTNKGRPSYILAHYFAGTRRLQAFVDLAEARTEARTIATKLSQGDLDVLQLRSADRVAYVRAVEALRPTEIPLELAAIQFAEAAKILGPETSVMEAARDYAKRNLHRLPTKTVEEAVSEMLRTRQTEGASQAYLKVLRVYLNQLAAAFHCPLGSLTSSDVSDFLRTMKVTARTKNNARATIGAFFKFCQERGWLPKDHERISLVPKFKETPGEIEIFTPKEMSKLLTCARSELVPFLAIGAFAGLRSAEIERLDWQEVDLKGNYIEVTAAKAKTARRRLIPEMPNLKAWLLPYAEDKGPVISFANVPKQLAWLADDASLRWKKNGLRHSFISYRAKAITFLKGRGRAGLNFPAWLLNFGVLWHTAWNRNRPTAFIRPK